MDLIIERGQALWGVEVKRSGFFLGADDSDIGIDIICRYIFDT